MATKKSLDNRVLVDRDEYAALRELEEKYEQLMADNARYVNRNAELAGLCTAQAKRLAEVDLVVQGYDRVVGHQRVFIDMLRADHPLVGSLEELSEFWRRWTSTTENMVLANPQQRGEVAKLEPDLFRTWRMWVRDAGRAGRSLAVAGTRAEAKTRDEVSAQQPLTQADLQEIAIKQLRDMTSAMSTRMQELESEVNAYKNNRKGNGAP